MVKSRSSANRLVLGLAAGLAALAVRPAHAADTSGRATPAAELPSLADRMMIASQIYHTVKRYFAHWENLPPTYDWDAKFRAYLDEAAAAPDRRAFSLATMRLVASLSNGHTHFDDNAFDDVDRLPFYARPVEGKWTVIASRTAVLNPGDIIERIDGVPIDTWLEPTRAIVGVSDRRSQDRLLMYYPLLMPQVFSVELAGGRKVRIDRSAPRGERRPALAAETVSSTVRSDGVVVIRIGSFDDPKYEAAAVEAVKSHAGAPLILFDVRGNGGGSTPLRLLATIMDKPYSGTLVATPITFAEFDAHESMEPGSNPVPKPMLRYGPEVIMPDPGHIKGRMALLIDGACGSACEDFAVRFQSGARGPVLGEATFGSTGQPIDVPWPRWNMDLRVSTKREYFRDGSPLEGVGVRPAIAVSLTIADIKSPGDPQLDRAVAAALSAAPAVR